MKPQINSRLVRLGSIILVIFCLCFIFSYLLDLEQQNTLRKEQEEEAARTTLKAEQEQEKKLLLEQAIEKEKQRIQKILDSRAVIEPGKSGEELILLSDRLSFSEFFSVQ